jgi:hypothetical protein
MRNTLNPLAQLLRNLVETERSGGDALDRWKLRDLIVAAGFPEAQANEAVAHAFPFPVSPEAAYISGMVWGSNIGAEVLEWRDFDEEGHLLPVAWSLKVLPDSKWVNRFLPLLRVVPPELVDKSVLPIWMNLELDGVLQQSFRLLGVGGYSINWEMIPEEHRGQFLAGVLDSTPIVFSGDFSKEMEGFNRLKDENELVLDADSFHLAAAIVPGIHGADLCSSHRTSDHLLKDENGPFGVRLRKRAIEWFLCDVSNWIHCSMLSKVKAGSGRFDSANKGKPNTGVHLTPDQSKELQDWVRKNRRKDITTQDLRDFALERIKRTISEPTAIKILDQFGLILNRTRKSRKP